MSLLSISRLKATRILSGFLAAWVCLATLASVSLAIHDWMHGGEEHACASCGHHHAEPEESLAESHSCGVNLLQSIAEAPETFIFFTYLGVLETLVPFAHVEGFPHPEKRVNHSRAPPVLS